MTMLKIRALDDQTVARLQRRALCARHSLEDEARELLRAAVATDPTPPRNFAEAIRIHFDPVGGVDLSVPVRTPHPEPEPR